MTLIYSPEEDSYLLEKVILEKLPIKVKEDPNLTFLEIGSGSGIQLNAAEKAGVKKENIFGVDLNIDAVKHCQGLGFNSMKSNLFDKVKERFDIIVFNPPYLPEDENSEDEESKLITTGGKEGSEVINNFLKESKNFLKKNGIIFLLTSSLTRGIDWQGYKKELIIEKRLFFEKLEVWKLNL